MSGFYSDDPFGDPFDMTPAVPSQPQPAVQAPIMSPSYQGGVSLVGNKDAYHAATAAPTSAPTPVGGPAMLANPFTTGVSSPVPVPVPVSPLTSSSGTSGFNPYSAPPMAPLSPAPGVVSPALAPLVASPAVSSPVPPVVVQDDDFGISWNTPANDAGSALKSHGPPPAPAPPAPRSAVAPPVPPRSPVSAPKASPTTTTTTTTSPSTPPQAVSKPPEGMLLARLSTRALFVREWKPCFWIILNNRLWLYRSKADFDPNDYIHNPFNDRIKKQILIRDCLRITEVKSKVYPGESQTLYTFNVEDSEEDGAKMVLAKFAAYDWDQIRALHEELHRRVADLTRAKRGK